MRNKKYILAALGLTLLALTPYALQASIIKDSESVETVGIFVRGLTICHQDEWRHLTVNLEYDTDVDGDARDIYVVKEHIRAFLKEFAQPADFWEIMNTKLVHSLREAFPEIRMMKSTLSLAPDRTLHFPRASTVSYDRGSDTLKESFNFTKLNYIICQETFRSLDLHVTWDINENPTDWDYPDYQWVDEAMEEFFRETPVSYSEWKSLKPKLQVFLLEKFPTLTSIDVDITIVE